MVNNSTEKFIEKVKASPKYKESVEAGQKLKEALKSEGFKKVARFSQKPGSVTSTKSITEKLVSKESEKNQTIQQKPEVKKVQNNKVNQLTQFQKYTGTQNIQSVKTYPQSIYLKSNLQPKIATQKELQQQIRIPKTESTQETKTSPILMKNFSTKTGISSQIATPEEQKELRSKDYGISTTPKELQRIQELKQKTELSQKLTTGKQGTISPYTSETLKIQRQKEEKFEKLKTIETAKSAGEGALYGVAGAGLVAVAPVLATPLAVVGTGTAVYQGFQISKISKERPLAGKLETSKFIAGNIGAGIGAIGTTKAINKFTIPKYEVTRAIEPTIATAEGKQTLYTKQFTELIKTKTPPKPDERIGFKFKSLAEVKFGSEKEGLSGTMRTGTKGTGFYSPKEKIFTVTTKEKLPEVPDIREFAPSKSKYVISSRQSQTKTDIGSGISILEPYTKVKVSKTYKVKEVLPTTTDKNIVSITKGEFYKIGKSLVLYEPPKPKPQGKKLINIPRSEIPEIIKPSIKIEQTSQIKSGSTVLEQTINKLKSSETSKYAPVVGIKQIYKKSTFVSPKFIETKESKLEQPKNIFFTEQTFQSKLNKDIIREPSKVPRLETIQVPKVKPIEKEAIIVETKTNLRKATIYKTNFMQETSQSPKSIYDTEKESIKKLKMSIPVKIKIPISYFPSFKLSKAKKKKKGRLVPTFDVFTRRRGKEKLLFTGLTKEEALTKGGRYVESTLARSLKLKPSGLKEQINVSSSFNLGKYRPGKSSKTKGFLVQKSKFSLGSIGERSELKRFKKFRF